MGGPGTLKKKKGKKKSKQGLTPARAGLLVLVLLLAAAAAWAQVSVSAPQVESTRPSKAAVDGIWLRIKPSHVEELLGPPDRINKTNYPHLMTYEYDFPVEQRSDPETLKMVELDHLKFKTQVTFRNDRVLEVVGRDLVLPDGREAHFLEPKNELMPLFDTSSRPGGLYWVGGITDHDIRATFYKKRLLWVKLRDRHR